MQFDPNLVRPLTKEEAERYSLETGSFPLWMITSSDDKTYPKEIRKLWEDHWQEMYRSIHRWEFSLKIAAYGAVVKGNKFDKMIKQVPNGQYLWILVYWHGACTNGVQGIPHPLAVRCESKWVLAEWKLWEKKHFCEIAAIVAGPEI